MKNPLNNEVKGWLESYCSDVRMMDNGVYFSLNDVRMNLSIDPFTRSCRIMAEVFDYDKYVAEEGPRTGCELANVMNRNMYPYSFIFDECDNIISARKDFPVSISSDLDFIIKVEVHRMFYLSRQIVKVYTIAKCVDLPDDENYMQFLLSVVNKWVAGDLLNITILYLHGFASSGNSMTAKEIQACLPNCKVVSPDLPINPADALRIIRQLNGIDMVVGNSLGGLLALFSYARNKILINPALHVSEMIEQRLGESDSVSIPYLNTRADGVSEFVLTKGLSLSYRKMEENVFNQSQLRYDKLLGIFGTADDVMDCKEDYLGYALDIRFFKGGLRLTKEEIEEVVVPSILQMVINEKMKSIL